MLIWLLVVLKFIIDIDLVLIFPTKSYNSKVIFIELAIEKSKSILFQYFRSFIDATQGPLAHYYFIANFVIFFVN